MKRNRLFLFTLLVLTFSPCILAKPKPFLQSGDAKEADEPHTFLPDYDKLASGSDADWSYFAPGADLRHSHVGDVASVRVNPFTSNGVGRRRSTAAAVAAYGKESLEEALKDENFEIGSGESDLVIDGNAFYGFQPSGAARMWSMGIADCTCGFEITVRDRSGQILAEIRTKGRDDPLIECAEDASEQISEALAKGK